MPSIVCILRCEVIIERAFVFSYKPPKLDIIFQKIQDSEPFHATTPITEFVNEPNVLDQNKSSANKNESKAQFLSESLYTFMIHMINKIPPKESGSKGSSRGSPI